MSGHVRNYGDYEIYNDRDEKEFTIRFPDDTRLDFPTLRAAKAGLRNIMRAEIVELKEQIARLDREIEAENPDNPV